MPKPEWITTLTDDEWGKLDDKQRAFLVEHGGQHSLFRFVYETMWRDLTEDYR